MRFDHFGEQYSVQKKIRVWETHFDVYKYFGNFRDVSGRRLYHTFYTVPARRMITMPFQVLLEKPQISSSRLDPVSLDSLVGNVFTC